MADQEHSFVNTSTPQSSSTSSQFEFPQLLIEASFESLLAHSHSSEPKVSTSMPRSEISLSESWSSLSEHDLSHEDDLNSEATDTGSLIDVSNVGDIHTVDDHGQSSDAEDEGHDKIDQEESDENDADHETRTSDDYFGGRRQQSPYTNLQTQESMRLDDSTVIVGPSGTSSLQASRTFADAEIRSTSRRNLQHSALEELVGTITMSVSQENLKLGQRPYHILYHGSTLSSLEIKSEVLGKIGAALINSGDSYETGESTESPCYHVVPSEFGPGSKPSTADLIPIPTQMHVSECTILETQFAGVSSSDICLDLGNGKTVVSRQAKSYDPQIDNQWSRPDLAVIIMSQNESLEGRSKARKVVEFADRHQIAVLCLRQEAGWDGDGLMIDISPHMLHKSVHSATQSDAKDTETKMLLDVDTFLALDTEQLNQHLSYLNTSINAHPRLQTGFGKSLYARGRDICYQFASLLPSNTVEKSGKKDQQNLHSTHWVIEVRQPQTPSLQKEHRTSKLSTFWNSKNRSLIVTALHRTAMIVAVTGLTSLVFFSSQVLLPHNPSTTDVNASRSIALQASIMNQPHSLVSSPTGSAVVTTTSTQTFALSGPLQALEQQVQSWMPVNMPRGRKEIKTEPRKQVTKDGNAASRRACRDIVPAHLSPNLKVSTAFFDSGEPAFEVRVRRGDDKVTAKIEKRANGVAAVMVKRKDCYGRLTVYLDGVDEGLCATVNLEDSIGEALTLWMKSLRKQKHQLKSAKRFANEYTRVLEVRTTKSGFVNNALELHYSAARGIGAAVEAVEKSAIKQAKVCHQNKNECFMHKLGLSKHDVLRPIQQARQVSEDLIRNTCQQISGTTQHARTRANEAAEQAREEISKAVQVVQSSISELTVFSKVWPAKVNVKLATAQDRARKLVKKSKSARGEHQGRDCDFS